MRGDLNLDTVELKVLLNGKFGDANFRNAYVIVILNAQEKKDNAEAPTAALSVQTVAAPIVPVAFKGNGTASNPYVIEVEPSTWVQLTATPSVKEGTLQTATAKWTVVGNASLNRAGNVIQAQAPATAYDETDKTPVTKLVYSIDNYNPTVDGNKTVTGKVYVEIRATGEAVNPSDTYDLTLGGILAGKGIVYANKQIINGTNNVYKIPQNADVVVYASATEIDANKTLDFDGVAVTLKSADNSASFKMTKSFALVLTSKNTAPSTIAPEVVKLTSVGGVTAKWAPDAAADGIPNEVLLPADGSVNVPKVAGKITLTANGTGKVVGTSVAVKANGTLGTNWYDANDATATNKQIATSTRSTDITLYALSKLTPASGISASGTVNGTAVTVSAGTATYVPVNVELTLSGGSDDAYIKYEGATAPKTAAAGSGIEKVTLVDTKDIGVVSMVKANLGEGVSATADGQALTDGSFVDATEKVTFTVSSDKAVVADKAGNGYGEAITAAAPLTKGEVYVAYTKVSVDASIAKVQLTADKFGNPRELTAGAAKTWGFAAGSTINIVGTKAASSIQVTAGSQTDVDADAADASTKISEIVKGVEGAADPNGHEATAEILVAERALSFKQA